MLASQEGHAEIARLLLDAGADMNLASHGGTTALMLASRQGHLGTVMLLLDAGAERNSVTDHGLTAVMLARYCGHLEIATLLQDVGAERVARKRPQSSDLPSSKRPRGSSATEGAEAPDDA